MQVSWEAFPGGDHKDFTQQLGRTKRMRESRVVRDVTDNNATTNSLRKGPWGRSLLRLDRAKSNKPAAPAR